MKKTPNAGMFRKGQTGNPGGRPKRTTEEFELIAACRAKTPDALATISRIMLSGENERNQLSAAMAIIERAHGKPVEHKEIRTGPLDSIEPDELIAAHELVKQAIAKAKATA